MSKVALFFEKMQKVFKNKAQRCSTPLKTNINISTTGEEDKLIGTYCGTDLATGAIFESTGPDMLVLFFSDGSFNERGFQAMFEFVPGKCIRIDMQNLGLRVEGVAWAFLGGRAAQLDD